MPPIGSIIFWQTNCQHPARFICQWVLRVARYCKACGQFDRFRPIQQLAKQNYKTKPLRLHRRNHAEIRRTLLNRVD